VLLNGGLEGVVVVGREGQRMTGPKGAEFSVTPHGVDTPDEVVAINEFDYLVALPQG
jgi:hypothetical protein